MLFFAYAYGVVADSAAVYTPAAADGAADSRLLRSHILIIYDAESRRCYAAYAMLIRARSDIVIILIFRAIFLLTPSRYNIAAFAAIVCCFFHYLHDAATEHTLRRLCRFPQLRAIFDGGHAITICHADIRIYYVMLLF